MIALAPSRANLTEVRFVTVRALISLSLLRWRRLPARVGGVMVATNTTPLVRQGTQERAVDDGLEQHKGPVEGTSGPLTPLVGRRLLSGFVGNPAVTQQDAGFTHTACPESSGRIEAPLGAGQCRGAAPEICYPGVIPTGFWLRPIPSKCLLFARPKRFELLTPRFVV